MDLTALGWNDFFAKNFEQFAAQSYSAGRTLAVYGNCYRLQTERGEMLARITGKMRYESTDAEDLPVVGDWVICIEQGQYATIHGILPRKSKFSRKTAGRRTEEQVVAANIDTVFLVMGLDRDFNVRRLERYLTLVWESGSDAVIVLNKADLCDEVDERIERVQAAAMGLPVVVTSATQGMGLGGFAPFLKPGRTVALLGSSGVGKSSLINRLLGREEQRVQALREKDQRGQHTTTRRELIALPGGGMVIDTPGMRELQLWGTEQSLSGAFDDVEELAARCRFRDCRHETEPGCAIRQAIADGALDGGRLFNYQKLQRELQFTARKNDRREELREKQRWKKITKMMRDNDKKR